MVHLGLLADVREQGYELGRLREDVHILLLHGFRDGRCWLFIQRAVFGSEVLAGDSLQRAALRFMLLFLDVGGHDRWRGEDVCIVYIYTDGSDLEHECTTAIRRPGCLSGSRVSSVHMLLYDVWRKGKVEFQSIEWWVCRVPSFSLRAK